MQLKIPAFVHVCVYPDGPLEGSKYLCSATEWDIRSQETCPVCGGPIAPLDEIVAHIYGQLTD